jgi:hypothetical protein
MVMQRQEEINASLTRSIETVRKMILVQENVSAGLRKNNAKKNQIHQSLIELDKAQNNFRKEASSCCGRWFSFRRKHVSSIELTKSSLLLGSKLSSKIRTPLPNWQPQTMQEHFALQDQLIQILDQDTLELERLTNESLSKDLDDGKQKTETLLLAVDAVRFNILDTIQRSKFSE